MKKLCLFVALVSLVALLCGCAPKEYQLIKKDGSCYIKLNKEIDSPISTGNLYIQEAAPRVGFQSFEEMIRDITNGDFTEEEWDKISRFQKDDSGNIPICDLDTLYVPQFPDTYDRFVISWSGPNYCFAIDSSDGPEYCPLFLFDETYWQKKLEKTMHWDTGALYMDVTSTQPDPERNGTVYFYPYVTHAADGLNFEYTGRKGCVYSFEQNGNTYYVCERYDSDAADAIPSDVSIFGISQGQHFYVFINEPNERPSMDWIVQFGLQVYSGK